MAEYIDREAAVSAIQDSVLNKAKKEQIGPMTVLAVAQGAVNKLPAADAEPVRHGHWVWKRRTVGGYRRYTGIDDMGEVRTVTVDERHETVVNYCSECGKRGDDTFLRYCPNCGAKMDKEEQQ